MSRIRIDLYYDVVSPYSYISFEVLCRYQKFWNIDLNLRPFFLGGVMKATGNKPPALLPAKQKYMLHDIQRISDFYQVPLNFPSDFATVMMSTLSCQRLLTSINRFAPSYLEAVTRELWKRIWNQDVKTTDPSHFVEVLNQVDMNKASITECINKMQEPIIKEDLKKTTNEALQFGSFGAPTIIVYIPDQEPQHYFGSDRFELIAHAINKPWHGAFPPNMSSKL